MQISKTQTYQYQLNKDIHHRNIVNSKPAVADHMHPATARTILLTHARPYNRDQPYVRQMEMQHSNHTITHRLIDIFDSKHSPLQSQGSYARYNEFERPFRAKNPQRDKTKREIAEQNQKLFDRLIGTKPRIGSISEWKNHHQKTSSYSKIKSRYQSSHKQQAGGKESLYESTLPEALQELEASLRRIRNSGKGRGGLGIDSSGARVELPKVEKKKKGLYYDIDLYL